MTEVSNELERPAAVERSRAAASLRSLPAEMNLRWGAVDGKLAFHPASPEPPPEATRGDCVIAGLWGDHRFDAAMGYMSLSTLVDLALPGCNLAVARAEARGLFLEHILSKALLNGRSELLNGIRVMKLYSGYNQSDLPPLFDVEARLPAMDARMRIFGSAPFLDAIKDRWSSLPQIPVVHAAAPTDIRFVSGVALLARNDLFKLSVGKAVVLDETLHRDGRVMVMMDDEPVAMGRRSDRHIIVDDQLDPTRAALPAIWSRSSGHGNDVKLTFEIGSARMRPDEFQRIARVQGIALPPRNADEVDIFIAGKALGQGVYVQLAGEVGVRVTRLY